MTGAAERTSPVERYYELVDRRDIDGLTMLFARDAWYERPGYERLKGRDAVLASYRDVRIIESGKHTLTSVFRSGGSVAVQGDFRGRLRVGRALSLRFADFFELDGELIAGRRTYFYTAMVLRADPDHRLGQAVVVRVADGADRGSPSPSGRRSA